MPAGLHSGRTLLFRIGSIYGAAADLATERFGSVHRFGVGDRPVDRFVQRAENIEQVTLNAEQALQAIVRIPPGDPAVAISSGTEVFGVLTEQGMLYESPLVDALGPSDMFDQRQRYGHVHTVRRYSDGPPANSTRLQLPRAPSLVTGLFYRGDQPYVTAVSDSDLTVYRVDEGSTTTIGTARFTSPIVEDRSSVVDGTLYLAVRDDISRITILAITEQDLVEEAVQYELDEGHNTSSSTVVGLRGPKLLLHTRPGLERVWVYAPEKEPELIVSAAGSLTGYCFSRYGLASVGIPFQDRHRQWFHDANSDSHAVAIGEPRCGHIADMDSHLQALALLQPGAHRQDWSVWPGPVAVPSVSYFDGRICRYFAAINNPPMVCIFSGSARGKIWTEDHRACMLLPDLTDGEVVEYLQRLREQGRTTIPLE